MESQNFWQKYLNLKIQRVINSHFTWIKYIIIARNKINHNFSFWSVLTVKSFLWLRAVISHSKKLQIINLDSKLHSQTLKEEILWIAIIGIHKYLNLSIHIFREINSTVVPATRDPLL